MISASDSGQLSAGHGNECQIRAHDQQDTLKHKANYTL